MASSSSTYHQQVFLRRLNPEKETFIHLWYLVAQSQGDLQLSSMLEGQELCEITLEYHAVASRLGIT